MPIPHAAHYISCPLQPHLLYVFPKVKYYNRKCPPLLSSAKLKGLSMTAHCTAHHSDWLDGVWFLVHLEHGLGDLAPPQLLDGLLVLRHVEHGDTELGEVQVARAQAGPIRGEHVVT